MVCAAAWTEWGIFTCKKVAFARGWGKNAERVVIQNKSKGKSPRKSSFFIGNYGYEEIFYFIIKG